MGYFMPSESAYPCCGKGFDHMSQELLVHLDAARHTLANVRRRASHETLLLQI